MCVMKVALKATLKVIVNSDSIMATLNAIICSLGTGGWEQVAIPRATYLPTEVTTAVSEEGGCLENFGNFSRAHLHRLEPVESGLL